MNEVIYKNHTIKYFLESFDPYNQRDLLNGTADIEVLNPNAKKTVLKFTFSITTAVGHNLGKDGIESLAVSKTKELIDEGLDNRKSAEFELMGKYFAEVIDLTK